MNDLKQDILNIFKLIKQNKHDEAEKILNELLNIKNKNISSKLKIIKNILNDSKKHHELKKEDENISTYLRLGKLSYYFGDHYYAFQYFSAGYYLTKDPLFLYYMGACMFYLEEYTTCIKLLKAYEGKGFLKIEKCYYYIALSYEILSETVPDENSEIDYFSYKDSYYKSSVQYFKKCNRIKEIRTGKIHKIKNQKSKKIDELLKKKDFKKIEELFIHLSNIDRINALKLLYMNGEYNFAEDLLNVYRKDLAKECKKELNKIEGNRKIYKMKSKIGGK